MQKPLARGGKERSENIARYKKFRARQTKNGYRWDDSMRSGEANVARCEPPGYSYLAEQCVPRAKNTSKMSKLATFNLTSNFHSQRRTIR